MIPQPQTFDFAVRRVHHVRDGDTAELEVDQGLRSFRLEAWRILDLDTPEKSEVGFEAATAFVTAWLGGRRLRLTSRKPDNFGRWLADVYDADTGDHLDVAVKRYMLEVHGIRCTYRQPS